MHEQRPINLNLTTMRFPITAISSILHRVSGIIIFLALPFLLYSLEMSLATEDGFQQISDCLTTTTGKLFLLATLSAIAYHLIAGIRHLLMDWGIGENKQSGKTGAKLVIIFSVLAIIALGGWLW